MVTDIIRETVIRLREQPDWKDAACRWFHTKWGIPLEAYEESMDACVRREASVPQWYIMLRGERIVAGLGVIENDFHDRKDLAPNVCAVYVEPDCRCQGIAGQMLDFVCRDMQGFGVDTLYLLTDHTGFYERYGWQFCCMAQGEGEEKPSRLYVHRMQSED